MISRPHFIAYSMSLSDRNIGVLRIPLRDGFRRDADCFAVWDGNESRIAPVLNQRRCDFALNRCALRRLCGTDDRPVTLIAVMTGCNTSVMVPRSHRDFEYPF